MSTGNRGRIALAKCLLQAAGIPYAVLSDILQDLFGWGRIGTGFFPAIGPPEIRVGAEDVERAAELLADLRGPDPTRVPFYLRPLAALLLLFATAQIGIEMGTIISGFSAG